MGEDTLAARERRELCELMDQLGPDAPTLCEGWTARELAAHLVLRERRMDAAPGIVLPVLAGHTARVQRGLAQRPWPELVDLVRSGPPRWSPLGVPGLQDKINAIEFFVHHEDVRRAYPGWVPRTTDARRAHDLWSLLCPWARLLYRHSPVGVVLRTPDGSECTVRRAERSVTVIGPAEELTLHANGRGAALVELDGDDMDVVGLQSSQRGV